MNVPQPFPSVVVIHRAATEAEHWWEVHFRVDGVDRVARVEPDPEDPDTPPAVTVRDGQYFINGQPADSFRIERETYVPPGQPAALLDARRRFPAPPHLRVRGPTEGIVAGALAATVAIGSIVFLGRHTRMRVARHAHKLSRGSETGTQSRS